MEFPGVLPISRVSVPGTVLDVIGLSDMHDGSPGFSRHAVVETVQEALDRRALVVGCGDYTDGVWIDDKRWAHEIAAGKDLANLVPDQYKDVVELLSPLKGRIIGLCRGNHEQKWIRRHGVMCLWTEFCKQLDAPDFGFSAMFDVQVWFNDSQGRRRRGGKPADRTVRFAVIHGDGGGNTIGGKVARGVGWERGIWGAHVVFYAHTHLQTAVADPKIGANADCSDHLAHTPLLVFTGGFLRSYSKGTLTYPEEHAMLPVALGAPIVHIYPHRIRAEVG
jgi:hypothetical protein